MFENLQRKSIIQEIQKKHFKFNFKKTTNLGKIYLLPKKRKDLSNVPGHPVTPNWGTPNENVPEFLDYRLQPLIKQGILYIKDVGDFQEKLRAN